MSLRIRWVGPVTAACGFLVFAVGGCSSSSDNAAVTDGGDDVVVHRMLDGSGAISGDDGSSTAANFDGTTGKTCAADKDCVSATGPGVNVCSTGFAGTASNGATVQFWSTPVCLMPLACDPGDLSGPVYCDGPATDSTSPGICVPLDPSDPTQGGLCYPKCSFTLGGSTTGCAGSNVCLLDWLNTPTTGSSVVTGTGFCQSACQKDADCSALGTGYACQIDTGLCTTKVVARTKAIGDSCTVSLDGGTDDTSTGACNCFGGGTGTEGFCSSVCVVGGTPCPNGYVCEDGEMATPFPGAPVQTAVTKGTEGSCVPGCALADGGVPEAGPSPTADASVDDGGDAAATPVEASAPAGSGSCPAGLTCQASTLESASTGPDCNL